MVLNFLHVGDHPLEASDDNQTFFVSDLVSAALVVARLASLVGLKDGDGLLDLRQEIEELGKTSSVSQWGKRRKAFNGAVVG